MHEKTKADLLTQELKKFALSYKFILEIDGIDKEHIKSCSLPHFTQIDEFGQSKKISRVTNIHINLYHAAAESLTEWLQKSISDVTPYIPEKRNCKITNDDKPFVEYKLKNCVLTSINFGYADYTNENFLEIQTSLEGELDYIKFKDFE